MSANFREFSNLLKPWKNAFVEQNNNNLYKRNRFLALRVQGPERAPVNVEGTEICGNSSAASLKSLKNRGHVHDERISKTFATKRLFLINFFVWIDCMNWFWYHQSNFRMILSSEYYIFFNSTSLNSCSVSCHWYQSIVLLVPFTSYPGYPRITCLFTSVWF